MKNYIKLSIIVFSLFLFANKPLFSQQPDVYLAFAQVMPQPVGGLPAIYKHITYPETAREAHLEGKVYLMVFVNTDGKVDNITVIKGLGLGCNDAAINAVKKVAFTPGVNNGVKVKVKLAIQITFQLDN